jgi:hypothetical protein
MPLRLGIVLLLISLAALAAGQETRLAEDPPLVGAPKRGAISGTLQPAKQVAKVQAVSRTTKQVYFTDLPDKSTGKFVIKDVPGDATYDLCVTTADGRSFEGIDLEMPDARLARLAEQRRKQLHMAAPPAHAFTADDANGILEYIAKTEDFMDIRRAIYLQGHGVHAAALVELLRTKEYYAAKPGELIWRMELWYFQFSHGQWERIPETERVLRRERIAFEKWSQIDLEYYPQLSVFVDAGGVAKPVDFTIPDKPDPSRGRPKNTKPELTTQARVMGVDEAPEPASSPAGK